MTRLAIIPKPASEKESAAVRRYFIVRLPPMYSHLRKGHD